jgi:hypothetical protein
MHNVSEKFASEPACEHEEPADDFKQAMQRHYSRHSAETNVNSDTLLATDYLNHFNEVAMMIGMLPFAPDEFLADLMAWKPLGYEEHFHHSGFRDRSLAIAAYNYAPDNVKNEFDAIIEELHSVTLDALTAVKAAMQNDTADVLDLCTETNSRMQELIKKAAAIINAEPAP